MKDEFSKPSVRTVCRVCRSTNLFLFLPMGAHPPANQLARQEDLSKSQETFDLNAQVCLNCGLIQVADQLPPAFFEDYLNVPSAAKTMHRHFAGLAELAVDMANGGLIVDVGCNDGLMLGHVVKLGAKALGIDPACNLAPMAKERGVDVLTDYFNAETARNVRDTKGPAAIITATNTLNHIDDLHGFMDAVDVLLAEDGVFVVEVPWGKMILEGDQFDNIYHEHLSELSLLSLVRLAEDTGFDVVDVTKIPVHGGSMRVFIRRRALGITPEPIVFDMLAEEHRAGMTRRSRYEEFAHRVDDLGSRLTAALRRIKAEGKTVAGFGAPAKGTTLTNYYRIGPNHVSFLVDNNPLKHGLYSPGMHIPILSPDEILERMPDYVLVLSWSFFEEIREQMAEYEKRGGYFIVPLPEFKILP